MKPMDLLCLPLIAALLVVVFSVGVQADVLWRGDVDKNGEVNAADAIVALQIGSGLVMPGKEYYDEFYERLYPNRAVVVYEDGTTLSLPSPFWEKTELPAIAEIDTTGIVLYLEYDGLRIAIDTSSDLGILKHNFRVLGIDPAKIDVLVLSDQHFDHYYGFKYFMVENPDIYTFAPMSKDWMLENDPSYPPGLTEDMLDRYIQVLDDCVMLTDKVCIYHTPTGEDDFPPANEMGEVAIALITSEGLVVMVAHGHPDVHRMVRRAKEITGVDRVYMYIGSTEFVSYDRFTVLWMIDRLRDEGVQRIAACHATGRLALDMLSTEWGENFIDAITGTLVPIPE